MRHGLRTLRLGRMSEMQVQALHLGHCSKVEMRVSIASWYYSGAKTRLSSFASWLLRHGFQLSRLDVALVAVPLCVWSLDSVF